MSDPGHRERMEIKGGELVENGQKRRRSGGDDVKNGVLEHRAYGLVCEIEMNKILVTAEVTLRYTFQKIKQ